MPHVIDFCCLLVLTSILNGQGETRRIQIHGGVTREDPIVAVLPNEEQLSLGTYHALLIGIQNYEGHEGIPNLQTALNDVNGLRQILVDDYCFHPDNVTTLRNEEATREAILQKLDEYALELDEQDNLLLFYAGHGTIVPPYECGGQEGFWVTYVPRGARSTWPRWLSVDAVLRATARINARHILTIADSCYSGALTATGRDVQAVGRSAPRAVQEWHSGSSNRILTSGAMEVVADVGHPIDGVRHSVFAYHLLTTLRDHVGEFLPELTLSHTVCIAVGGDDAFRREQGFADPSTSSGRKQRRMQMPQAGSNRLDQRGPGYMVLCRRNDAGLDVGTKRAIEPDLGLEAFPGYRFARLSGHPGIRVERSGDGYRYFRPEGSTEVEMVLIGPASYRRPGGDEVFLVEHPFLLDIDEVDNARIRRWVDEGRPVLLPVEREGRSDRLNDSRGRRFSDDESAFGFNATEARQFAAWAGGRLPSELEWELAAGIVGSDGILRSMSPGYEGPDVPPADARSGLRKMHGGLRELCELNPRSDHLVTIRGGRELPGGHRIDHAAEGPSRPITLDERPRTMGFRLAMSLWAPHDRGR